jgi:hypothetical protein
MNECAAAENCPDRIHRLSTRREAVMSALAIAFLILTALALHGIDRGFLLPAKSSLVGIVLAALWLAIVTEALVGYWRCGDHSWRSTGRLLLVCLLPPFRLSVSTFSSGSCIWLPMIGWQIADHSCYERLDRAFSVPMLFIALMILPILAVEIFWAGYVRLYPALALALNLGTATIWFAFSAELIVMSAVADKKLLYLARNWLNLAIILLPFLAFLRGLQIARLLRLARLGKALKIYRLRGLSLRAWKGAVTLELLERLLHPSPEARLGNLRRRFAEKERELERLRDRIQDLEAVSSAGRADTTTSENRHPPQGRRDRD